MMLTRLLKGLGLLAVGAVVGWLVKPQPAQLAAKQQTEVVSVTETKTVRQPDGTVTVVQVEKKTEKKDEVKPAPAPSKPDYSVAAAVRLKDINVKPDFQVTLGRRLLGSLWLEVGLAGLPAKPDLTVGLRVEF